MIFLGLGYFFLSFTGWRDKGVVIFCQEFDKREGASLSFHTAFRKVRERLES